ncbi:hypothetical protein TNCV_1433391 [Trichonephila clavipes]|nr:hypothetical protein TNCV_1433391 [Trichonephila clavipes]
MASLGHQSLPPTDLGRVDGDGFPSFEGRSRHCRLGQSRLGGTPSASYVVAAILGESVCRKFGCVPHYSQPHHAKIMEPDYLLSFELCI